MLEVDTSFLAVFCLPNRQKQGLCLKQLKAGPENQLQVGVPTTLPIVGEITPVNSIKRAVYRGFNSIYD